MNSSIVFFKTVYGDMSQIVFKFPFNYTFIMTEDDSRAGMFSDEQDSKGREDRVRSDEQLGEESRTARDTKQKLISQAVTDGTIHPLYAELLKQIRTATGAGGIAELATLDKVQASLEMKDKLGFDNGRVAYIGSGNDWQFAVALGANQIDMVSDSYMEEPASMEELFRDIQAIDPAAQMNSNGTLAIQFGIDLGHGKKNIALRLFGMDYTQYDPGEPLSGVIEYAGPTKGPDNNIPVLPDIARHLSPGAKVVNFDYMKAHPGASPRGFQNEQVGKFNVLTRI